MKKIMMIAAMMIATISASAQNEVGQLTLQPKAGINLSNITGENDTKMKIGLVAGVEAEYGISENFGLVMDAETERRMDIMCNLSEVMIEQGIEKGIEKGIEAFIADKLEDEVSSDIIIHKLEKRLNLSNDKACEYLRKYSESITEKSD